MLCRISSFYCACSLSQLVARQRSLANSVTFFAVVAPMQSPSKDFVNELFQTSFTCGEAAGGHRLLPLFRSHAASATYPPTRPARPYVHTGAWPPNLKRLGPRFTESFAELCYNCVLVGWPLTTASLFCCTPSQYRQQLMQNVRKPWRSQQKRVPRSVFCPAPQFTTDPYPATAFRVRGALRRVSSSTALALSPMPRSAAYRRCSPQSGRS